MEMPTLLALVRNLRERYGDGTGVWVQSNGDLLDPERLGALVEAGVDRLDIVSMDRFHKQGGSHRGRLEALFQEAGWSAASTLAQGELWRRDQPVFAFWGANEEIWLKGNWARGRALETGNALLDPGHNFCALWSGARGFLDAGSPLQEVHVQLTRLYPCCPTTFRSLGDVREHPVETLLDRVRGHPVWEALNRGEPGELGEDRDRAARRTRELGDVCLWCDEFFRELYQGPGGAERPPSQRTRFDV